MYLGNLVLLFYPGVCSAPLENVFARFLKNRSCKELDTYQIEKNQANIDYEHTYYPEATGSAGVAGSKRPLGGEDEEPPSKLCCLEGCEGCEIDGGALVDGGDETDDELRDL